jgi:protein TonB
MVDIVYTALAALLVVVVLHVAVFWVTRFIQPPKPRIVYLPAAQPQQQPLPPPPQQLQPPPQLPLPPPAIQLPTYDSPPVKTAPPALPPPIETRESKGSALPQPGLPHPGI